MEVGWNFVLVQHATFCDDFRQTAAFTESTAGKGEPFRMWSVCSLGNVLTLTWLCHRVPPTLTV